MKKNFSYVLLFGLTAAGPAFATVTVGSPGNGADVSSPFHTLRQCLDLFVTIGDRPWAIHWTTAQTQRS